MLQLATTLQQQSSACAARKVSLNWARGPAAGPVHEYTDWSLQLGDVEFHVHRCIVAPQSEYLEGLLRFNAQSSAVTNTTDLGPLLCVSEDQHAPVAQAMEWALTFMYSCGLERRTRLVVPSASASLAHLWHVGNALGIRGMLEMLRPNVEACIRRCDRELIRLCVTARQLTGCAPLLEAVQHAFGVSDELIGWQQLAVLAW